MLLRNRLDQYQRDALIIAIAACAIALAYIAAQIFQVEYWRHDDARYLTDQDFLIRARGDGRWLNHLLRGPTVAVDPRLAWVIDFLAIGTALYLIFARITQDKLAAALLALTGLLFPGLLAQATWPNTILPGAVVFLISVALVHRFGWLCLPFVAIVQFGTMQYFYYILPLAFLPPLSKMSLREFAVSVRLGVIWALGVLLGYFAASFANLWLVGEFGISIASWRSPNVTTDAAAFLENVARYAGEFAEKIAGWLPGVSILMILAGIGAVTVSSIRSRKSPLALLARASYALVVLFSAYLFILPLGIYVPYRSLFSLAIGLIALPIVLTERRFLAPMAFIIFLSVGLPSIFHSAGGIKWYAETTKRVAAVWKNDLPRHRGDGSIIVDGREIIEFYSQIATQAAPTHFAQTTPHRRLNPLFKEFGYDEIQWCLDSSTPAQIDVCREVDAFSEMSAQCNDMHGRICILGNSDGALVVRLVP